MDQPPSSCGGRLRALVLHPKLLALLSLALLACQIGTVWFAGAFPTQDGPSHSYNALIVRELLFHPGSAFRSLYALNGYPTSNWTTTILLGLASTLVGVAHAEQILATIAILFFYGGLCYLLRALAVPRSLPWAGFNILANAWFLWMGFYSFYLAVALSLFCAGYYIRHVSRLTTKHYLWIALLVVALYFTHPLGQFVTCLTLSVLCLWDRVCAPSRTGKTFAGLLRDAARSYAPLLLSFVPGGVFVLIFARHGFADSRFAVPLRELGSRLRFFPVDVFSVDGSEFSSRITDVICVLLLLAVFSGVLLWKRANWRGPQGGVFLAAVALFGVFLLTPEEGGDAGFVTERLAWVILALTVAAVSARTRSRALLSTMALFLLPFAGAQLYLSARATRSAAAALGQFRSLERHIPPGAAVLELIYSADRFEQKYELSLLNYNPLLHALDGLALRRRFLAWNNYEAASRSFPVVFRSLTPDEKNRVMKFQDREEEKSGDLELFLERFGSRADYIVVYGELPRPGEAAAVEEDLANDLLEVLKRLDRDYDLAAVAGERPTLRLYKRKM